MTKTKRQKVTYDSNGEKISSRGLEIAVIEAALRWFRGVPDGRRTPTRKELTMHRKNHVSLCRAVATLELYTAWGRTKT